MRRMIWIGLAGLAACTMPEGPGATVREATEAEIAGCRYITDIRMTPGVYGPVVTEQALSLARMRVKSDAARAGADTIVFAAPAGATVYQVEAAAYRCAP